MGVAGGKRVDGSSNARIDQEIFPGNLPDGFDDGINIGIDKIERNLVFSGAGGQGAVKEGCERKKCPGAQESVHVWIISLIGSISLQPADIQSESSAMELRLTRATGLTIFSLLSEHVLKFFNAVRLTAKVCDSMAVRAEGTKITNRVQLVLGFDRGNWCDMVDIG